MNKRDYEKILREKAVRLIQLRAGGRYQTFEAGQLYEICLALGMKDCRLGKIGEQEKFWENIVCSFSSEKEAKKALQTLITDYPWPNNIIRMEKTNSIFNKESTSCNQTVKEETK